MTREEKEILKAIQEMVFNRTKYSNEKVGHVINMAIEALQEQKTGKWNLCTSEKYDVDYYVCSNCGYEPYRKMDISNYCPNCGARMIGKKE